MTKNQQIILKYFLIKIYNLNEKYHTKRSKRTSKLNLIQIAHKDRDNVEKAFLGDRIGAYNKVQEKIKLNDPDPFSPLYLNESERFIKDFAVYDLEKRKQEVDKRKNRYENYKNVLFDRETKRWEKMEYDYIKTENKIIGNKEKVLVGKKNNPG